MTKWAEVGPSMAPGGVVGGDGAGESVTRRWQRRNHDGTWLVVTAYGYPVSQVERYGESEDALPWFAEVTTEAIVCTDPADPGSTEISSDYETEESALGFPTEAGAAEEAARYIRTFDMSTPETTEEQA